MIPLIYVLHNGNLYGMEQMALATLDGLRDDFEPYLFGSRLTKTPVGFLNANVKGGRHLLNIGLSSKNGVENCAG